MDPTPFFEIRNGVPDGIIQRDHVDPQNPIPLHLAEPRMELRFCGVVVRDTRLDARDPERSGGPLRGLDELLVRNG